MFMAATGREALVAPPRLLVDTRAGFRQAAMDYVRDKVAEGAPEIVLDLSETTEIDASGMGILVLIQEWSRRYDRTVRLHGVQRPVRDLLELTQLTGLFRFS